MKENFCLVEKINYVVEKGDDVDILNLILFILNLILLSEDKYSNLVSEFINH